MESFNYSKPKVENVLRKDSRSSRQGNSMLSRMNSKVSHISSKKKGPGAGLKLKIDELSKNVIFLTK